MAKKPVSAARKPTKRAQPKRSRGRPKGTHWQPTKEERLMVELAVGAGYTRAQIAKLVGKSVDSLERHCRDELDTGDLKAGTKISGALYSKAMKGDVAAIIWWEKTRRGLSERMRHHHTFNLEDLTDEELETLERISARNPQP